MTEEKFPNSGEFVMIYSLVPGCTLRNGQGISVVLPEIWAMTMGLPALTKIPALVSYGVSRVLCLQERVTLEDITGHYIKER